MKPFHFYWGQFNPMAGIKYVAGILLLTLLAQWIEFPWFIVGLSALLTWLMDISDRSSQRIILLILYMLVGAVLTWVSFLLKDMYWPWLIFMFLVAFTGTLILVFGQNYFMTGWSLIYWIMLSPVIQSAGTANDLVLSFLLGSGSVIVLVLIEIFLKTLRKKRTQVEKQSERNKISLPYAVLYSMVVSSTIILGLILGDKFLVTDPTMISNAAFMVIGFSVSNTWKGGLERFFGVLLAIFVGFAIGIWFNNELFGKVLSVVMSFFVLALLNVNNGLVMFCFLIIMGYGWGLMDFETGNMAANERILSELSGIILAGISISFLKLLPHNKMMQ